ncbi:histidine kinase [Chitinophaga sp. GCM10012297]|uniref:Histidine kinase n=1 Tax=Chitinophaga chungangae TaxID=2821488 RepID=A0ABS3YEA0_9BACT|nr:histidine kinase [Chitinophaga chungangae]MBO9152988.1 histidine kinase [Chitinophaga chungangae]
MPATAYIAIIAALILLLAVIYRQMARYRRQYRTEATLNYFTTSLFGKNTVDDILWDVAKNCISRLHLEDCVIYLVDEERGVLVQKAAYGPKNPVRFEIRDPIEIRLGRGIVGSVAVTGRPELIPDTSKDPRYIVDDERRLSEITVPITESGKVIGIIDSEHSRRNFYTAGHLVLLQRVAAICASKISRTVMEEEARRQAMEVQLLHKQLAEFRLVTLKSQMNPHFLFNCLNGIYHCILASDIDKASDYVSNFARLLRMVLMHAEKNFISLREEVELLGHYLKIEALRTNKPFEYAIYIEDGINPDEYFVPGMLIQPFLENAIWHGLMNKEGDRSLNIHWRRPKEKELLCEITDNGVGRAQSIRRQPSSHASKGMSLCMERVELYKALFNTTFHIRVIDLYGEDGVAQGTKVNIAFEIAPGSGVAHMG